MIFREKIKPGIATFALLAVFSWLAPHGIARSVDAMQAEDAIAAQYGQLDAILNAKYQALLLKLRGEPRENLVIAQRAWLKFRDAECKYQLSFPHRPSESGDFRHQCLIGLTKARIAQLENQLQCQGVEGDVGCR